MNKVKKRDGTTETLSLEKWQSQIAKICSGIADVSQSMIEIKSQPQFYNGISTKEIDEITLRAIVDLIDITSNPDIGNTNYQYVAGKQRLSMLRKSVYGDYDPPSLYDIVVKNINIGLYTEELLEWYTKEESDKMDKFIDHSKDEEYSYAAIEQLIEKYLVQNRSTKEVYESPQVRYMIVSATAFHNEKTNRMKFVKDFYNAASDGLFTLPTPVLAGLGTKTKQFSSCVLLKSGDNLQSIFKTGEIMAKYASKKAGIGMDVGAIRGIGAPIRKGEIKHTGMIPFLKKWHSDLRSCCLRPDMIVEIFNDDNNIKMKIDDVELGMKIKTIDENYNIVYKTITNKFITYVNRSDQVYLKFSNGTQIHCSNKHPIMVKNGEEIIKVLPTDLTTESQVITDCGFTNLTSIIISSNDNDERYIDITVEDTHTFFTAHDIYSKMILTHNSQGGIRNACVSIHSYVNKLVELKIFNGDYEYNFHIDEIQEYINTKDIVEVLVKNDNEYNENYLRSIIRKEGKISYELIGEVIKIDEVKIDDYVLACDIKNKKDYYRKVLNVMRPRVEHSEQVRIISSNGSILTTSKTHPTAVYVGNEIEYIPGGEIRVGDNIVCQNGTPDKVLLTFQPKIDEQYADFSIDEFENYYAGDNKKYLVLAHNSATVFYPIWHYQFDDLIVVKNNQGTDETRVRHLDYGVVLNSLFYKRFKNKENITFFDPHEVPEMYNAFYKDSELFEELYIKNENDPTLRKKVMSAEEVFKGGLLKERMDTGRIYLVNIDNVMNQGSFDPMIDPVYQSNLCCLKGDTKIDVKFDDYKSQRISILSLVKNIQSYKEIFDEVYIKSFKKCEIHYTPISDAFKTKSVNELYLIKLSNDSVLECTGDHRVYTINRNYVEAKDLLLTDTMLVGKISYFEVRIDSIEIVEYPDGIDVYDITVPETSCFFANDILVHNCEIVLPTVDIGSTTTKIIKVKKNKVQEFYDNKPEELVNIKRVMK